MHLLEADRARPPAGLRAVPEAGAAMTPTQQQKRRRELYAMPQRDLEKLYAKLSGHLLSEVRRDTMTLSSPIPFLVDVIVQREARG